MRALVTRGDGIDALVSRPVGSASLPPAGAVLDGWGRAVEDLPFGLVELVVPRGRGAGLVRRLEVGTFRCGASPLADVPLPVGDADDVLVRVALGGEVTLDGSSWPVGEARRLGELDVVLRWCAPPLVSTCPVETPDLPDLLLARLAGLPAPRRRPTWHLGRRDGRVDEPIGALVEDHPVLVVTGPGRHAVAGAVLARLLHEAGSSVRLTVLAADAPDPSVWAWLRWVPQARAHDERYVRVGFDDVTCDSFVADVPAGPGVLDVVVVDGAAGRPPGAARPGVAVLVLQDSAPTSSVDGALTVQTDGSDVALLQGAGEVIPLGVDLPDLAWLDHLARTLAAPEPERLDAHHLRLADLLGAEPDDLDALAAAWDGPTTTRVPLGAHEGAPVAVDLRTDGPHALIGGTTGSGKSELLVALVAGLAALNPPEAVSFLLVDYKGGAAFADCVDLPHTLGLLTDLDSSSTERALAALGAEVRRRERILAGVGAADLEAYEALPERPEQVARLVIVVDEFATLVTELPEFVDGLVDIARRGRSLGLHLVLATQRPAGAVDADIRANMGLRISLRVAEVEDSIDVLGLPDAAGLSAPGQALARVGQSALVPLQVARVTTHGPLAATPEGEPYEFGHPVGARRGVDDLSLLVRTARELADRRGVPRPPRPWLPPLPTSLDLDAAPALAAIARPGDGRIAPRAVPFGVTDLPDEQRRGLAVFDLDGAAPLAVVGGARSGRTTTLHTIATAAVRRVGPDRLHLYVIDAGAHGLTDLARAPHTGALVGRDEPDRIERLILRLTVEMDRRSRARARAVAAVETGRPELLDDEDACGSGGSVEGASVGEEWPTILLLVDRWDLLLELVDEVDDRGVAASLERLALEGGRVGIRVVASGGRALTTTHLSAVFPDVLRLRGVEWATAGAGATPAVAAGEASVPAGRGRRGELLVETQVALSPRLPVAASPVDIPAESRPFRIDPLPTLVSRAEALALVGRVDPAAGTPAPAAGGSEAFTDAGDAGGVGDSGDAGDADGAGHAGGARIVAGADVAAPRCSGALLVAVGGDEVGPRWFDAGEYGPCALVTGRRRSGRSGTLATFVESALVGGWMVAAVTARRSPLADLHVPEAYRDRWHGPFRRDEDAPALLRVVEDGLAAQRRVLVVVDDLDLLLDGPLLDAVGELPVRLRDTGSLLVASAEAEDIVAAYRGPAMALRRARCGIMLAPSSATDGEAFGVRLRRSQYERPAGVGSGFFVLDGMPERVQVVRSSYLPLEEHSPHAVRPPGW